MGVSGLTYYAKFTANRYTVSLEAGVGIASVSGAGEYLYGAEINISAEVEAGYTWSGWTGYVTTVSNPYSFTMPASEVTVKATATANVYTVTFNGNGHTAGSTASQQFTYAQAGNLNANGFKQEYTVTFNGNGGSQYLISNLKA